VSVKADKTKASYREGVLLVELPKSEEARLRRVAVQTARIFQRIREAQLCRLPGSGWAVCCALTSSLCAEVGSYIVGE
jgi:hypothetical protein